MRRASEWLRGRSRADWALAAITLGGLALRVGYVVAARKEVVAGDGDGYYWSGRLLADGHGFISSGAYRLTHDVDLAAAADHPPGWILVLAALAVLGFQSVIWFQLLACAVGAATVAAVGVAGRRIGGPRVGLIAAAIAALYPNLWMYERVLQCETLALLLTALSINAAYAFWEKPSTRGSAWLGVLVALLTMTRPEALLVGPLVVAPAIWLRRGDIPARTRLGWSALAAAIAVAPIVPWAIYNTMRFDETVVLTTNLGQTLVASNCDQAYYDGEVGWWSYQCLQEASGRVGVDGADAAERDIALQEIAFDYMGDHTRRLPTVVLAREGRTWGFYKPFHQVRLESLGGPTEGVGRAGLLTYWPLLALAVVGGVIVRRRRLPLFPQLGFVATVVIASGLTIGQVRYRALAEIPIVLLAAVTLSALASLRRRPSAATEEPADDEDHDDLVVGPASPANGNGNGHSNGNGNGHGAGNGHAVPAETAPAAP